MVLDDVLGIRSNYTDVLAGSRTFFWGISCYFFPGGWILEERGAGVSGLGKPYIWGVFNNEGEGLRIETAVIGLSGKVRGLTPIGAKADDIRFQLINVVVVVQSLSVVWLCNPINGSMPGFSVLHKLTGVCSNSCPLSQWCHSTISSSVAPFSSCPNLSQHQGLFQWIGFSHKVANVSELWL